MQGKKTNITPYLLIGIRFSRLVKMIFRNGIGCKPVILLRLFLLFQNSFWASIMSRFEKIKFRSQITSAPLPDQILIIIGHWRTGSTYLHNLMSQDENFTTPSLFHTAYPDSFLFSEKYIKPVMRLFVRKHRPMDQVELGVDLPQEDEYALIRMAPNTPLEKLIFPDKKGYFLLSDNLNHYDDWKKALYEFCKKLHFTNSKNILLKNPFHSLRIADLAEMFPQAKFICLHRHPYSVVPSTIKLWSVVGSDNNLKGNFVSPNVQDVSGFFNILYNKIEADLAKLPAERFSHLKYEDLEADPEKSIRNIYESMNIPFSNQFRDKLHHYISSLGKYQKNHFKLDSEHKEIISRNLKTYMEKLGYLN